MKKGFTLIELLIVIALLGALAVGLLAAVDPFEQLKKGTDTSIRNTAAEFYNATIRYYANRTAFPGEMTDLMTGQPLSSLPTAISSLGDAGELKSDFSSLAGTNALGRIYVTITGATDKVIVCTNPQSKSFRNSEGAKYDQTGGINSSCPTSGSAGTGCYICFQ